MNNQKKIFILNATLAISIIVFFICGCASHLRTPIGWTIEKTGERPCCNPFGIMNPVQKKIKIMPPKWLPQKVTNGYILDHELGHAWGIKGCNHMYCIMYEPESAGHSKNNKLYETLAKPLQFFYGMRFCKKCKKFLEDKKAYK